MKTKLIKILIGGFALSSFSSFATNVNDLKLDCGGKYKILESKKYFVDNSGTRVNSYFGNEKKIQVLAISGGDCHKLVNGYGITLDIGEVLVLGKPNGIGKLEWLGTNHEEIGMVVNFGITQNFSYKTKDGELPWFPTLHEESLNVLGKNGKANAALLYGTPELKDISDKTKNTIVEKIMQDLKWGKDFYNNYIGFYNKVKIKLALKLIPVEAEAQLEYLNNMLHVFKNITKSVTSFVTLDYRIAIGSTINKLLNKFGATKYGYTKLDVWKKNPIFFAEQLVSWVSSDIEKAPVLTEQEVEDYLSYVLDMSKKLKQVQNLYEAQVLLVQYKNSAIVIKKVAKGQNLSSVHYALTTQASEDLEEILKI